CLVGKRESEWLGVWPACIVSRWSSSAASTSSVCSLELLLCFSSGLTGSMGGDGLPDDCLDPVGGDTLCIKVDLLMAFALMGMPSSAGLISCTSTVGTGPLSRAVPSIESSSARKSPWGFCDCEVKGAAPGCMTGGSRVICTAGAGGPGGGETVAWNATIRVA